MMRNLLVLCLAAYCAPAFAQDLSARVDTTSLTLTESLGLALAESYDARVVRLALIEAEQDVAAARGRFKTQVGLALDAPNYNESVQGVNQPGQLPQYTSYGSREWRAGLSLTQPLPTNGSIGLSGDVYHRTDSVYDDATNTTLENRTFFNRYRLDFYQPLLVPNTLKLSLERAQLTLDESRRNYTAAQLDIVYEVTAQFYEFLRAQRRLVIARTDLARQEEAYQLATRKFAAGLIPEVEALQMEVDLAQSRNDLLSAEGGASRAADRFKLVVGLPMDAPIRVTAETAPRFYEVDRDLALQHALAHRAEIRNTETNVRRAEITVSETDARSAIKGELRAYYDLTGIGSSEDDLSLRDMWDLSWQDLEQRPGNKGVVFTLSVPIWDSGVNGAEVASARAALERSEIDIDQQRRTVVLQVNAALTALSESRARLDALVRSVAVATRSLDISLQRFDNGDITSQDLALDRSRLTQASLAYLDAFIQYQLAGADLRRQTLYDFEMGRSLVAGETVGR
jgi:outer membrane protein TolC